jgi:hypothetical protein
MGIFDDDDDFFNDNFMNYWEKFNNRMKTDENFRNEMEKSDRDFQKLLKMFITSNQFDIPLDFRIIPLNTPLKNDFGISENDMDIKNGIDENGEWETKNWTSPDGSISFSSFSRSSGIENFGNNSKPKNTKPDGTNKKLKIAKLQKALDYVVEQENYEKASEIKKMIDELNSDTNEKE